MMIVRKMLIFVYGRITATALTVAIRYSIARQQFKNDQGVENSVLEYQSQQDKLLPLLAKQYAVLFGGFYAKNLVEDNFERVKKKDFSVMQLTHALLSGCKANYTYFAQECFEWCRLSCGGHGFGHYSGLPG
jgi:acyl-CoA oxidase